jgi:hypothetical protein
MNAQLLHARSKSRWRYPLRDPGVRLSSGSLDAYTVFLLQVIVFFTSIAPTHFVICEKHLLPRDSQDQRDQNSGRAVRNKCSEPIGSNCISECWRLAETTFGRQAPPGLQKQEVGWGCAINDGPGKSPGIPFSGSFGCPLRSLDGPYGSPFFRFPEVRIRTEATARAVIQLCGF